MDVIINTRCELIRNLIEEREVYEYCGLNPFEKIREVAQQMDSDLKTFIHGSWSQVHHKFSDYLLMAALLKRRAQLCDVEGLLWCIERIYRTQQKTTYNIMEPKYVF